MTKVNSLRPSNTIWWQKSGSTLNQVMACCLMAPIASHHRHQYQLVIKGVLWHSQQFYRKCSRYLSSIWVWKWLTYELYSGCVSHLFEVEVVVDGERYDEGQYSVGHAVLGDTQLLVGHRHLVDACVEMKLNEMLAFRPLLYLMRINRVGNSPRESNEYKTCSLLRPKLSWTHNLIDGSPECYFRTRESAHTWGENPSDHRNTIQCGIVITWLIFPKILTKDIP